MTAFQLLQRARKLGGHSTNARSRAERKRQFYRVVCEAQVQLIDFQLFRRIQQCILGAVKGTYTTFDIARNECV